MTTVKTDLDPVVASRVPFTPRAATAASDVQSAIERGGGGGGDLAAHEAAGDPHPQYTTSAEAATAAASAVATHEAAGDPHPQYTTSAEAATAAASAVATHEAAGDPHPGYVLEADLANASDVAKGSALVGFKRSWTNSVGRTVSDKIAERGVCVLDFGSNVGTGSDDSEAFQKLFDYLSSLATTTEGPIGEFFAPAGYVYRFDAGVTMAIPVKGRVNGLVQSYVTSGDTFTFGDKYFRNGRNWGYDVAFASIRSMVGNTSSEPTTINESGANAISIRAAQHSRFRIGRAIGFSKGGVYFDCSNTSYRATVTISIASPAVITWTGHGKAAGDEIIFSTTGALPTGISANITYYVIAAGLTANTFQISATSGGSAINTTGTQSGTHSAGGYQHIQGNDFWIGEATYNGFGVRANSDDALLGAFQNNHIFIGNSHRNQVNLDIDLAGGGYDDTANNTWNVGLDAAAAGGTNVRMENGQYNKFTVRYMDGVFYFGGGASANHVVFLNNETSGVTLSGNTAQNYCELHTNDGIKVVSGKFKYDAGQLEIDGALLPITDGSHSLGSASKRWAKLFLKVAGEVDWGNGNVRAVHTTDLLTLIGRFAIDRPGADNYCAEYINSGTGDAAIHLLHAATAEITMGSDRSDGHNFKVSNTGDVGVGTGITYDWANGILSSAGAVKTAASTVASLPSAATLGASARRFVTDATATTFGTVVAGGGANGVPVFSDGTNWRIG